MNQDEQAGRLFLFLLITWNLVADLSFTLVECLLVDTEFLVEGIVRFILSVLLYFLLFRGYSWARWLVISLASLAALAMSVQLILFRSTGALVVALLAAAVLGTALMAGVLLFSAKVKGFLQLQKTRRLERVNGTQASA